jgi:hypothetical protein
MEIRPNISAGVAACLPIIPFDVCDFPFFGRRSLHRTHAIIVWAVMVGAQGIEPWTSPV